MLPHLLLNKWERDNFLDWWWDTSPRTYLTYYQQNDSRGKSMIDDLADRDPKLFTYLKEQVKIDKAIARR